MQEHLVEAAKEVYLSSSITLKELSQRSVEFLGVGVTVEELKQHSRSGRWGTLKRRQQMNRDGLPSDARDAMEDIAEVVYDKIMDPDHDMSAQGLSSMVSAFVTLSQRGASGGEVSAKTDLQKVLDAIRKSEDATEDAS